MIRVEHLALKSTGGSTRANACRWVRVAIEGTEMEFFKIRKLLGNSSNSNAEGKGPTRRRAIEVVSHLSSAAVMAVFVEAGRSEWISLTENSQTTDRTNANIVQLFAVVGMPFVELCDQALPDSWIYINVSWLNLRPEVDKAIRSATVRGVRFFYAPLKLNCEAARARYDQLWCLASSATFREQHERSIEDFHKLQIHVGKNWLQITPQSRPLDSPFFLRVPPDEKWDQSVAYLGRFLDGDREHPFDTGRHEIVRVGPEFEKLKAGFERRMAA